MDDLADFLLARIGEEERDAQALQAAYERDEVGATARQVMAGALLVPARVLAECDAKRRIVDAWKADATGPLGDWDDYAWYAIEWAMKALALPYADYPDYQQEWRP